MAVLCPTVGLQLLVAFAIAVGLPAVVAAFVGAAVAVAVASMAVEHVQLEVLLSSGAVAGLDVYCYMGQAVTLPGTVQIPVVP